MKTVTKAGADVGEQVGAAGSEIAVGVVPKVKDVITTDEYAGQGGSYVFDPATRQRTLSAETIAAREESRQVEAKRAAEKAAADKANEEEGN